MKNKLTKIKSGRFDKIVSLSGEIANDVTRVRSTHNPGSKVFRFIPISTNGEHIFQGEKFIDAREYIASLTIKDRRKIIVLTNKERHFLTHLEAEFGAKIWVFEINFKHVGNIRYSDDLRKLYFDLTTALFRLKKNNIYDLSLGIHFTNLNLHRIARKLRFKCTLDQNFYFANQKGVQEVFRLCEEREDRSIVALDFNSMYPSCMNGEFVEPRRLEHWVPTETVRDTCGLHEGLYRVTFKSPSKAAYLFGRRHPFSLRHNGRSYQFNLECTHEIECLVFKFEIEKYQIYFNSIDVHEGVVSKSTIPHPLYKRAMRLYKEKKNYKKQGSNDMKDLLQFELQSLHGSSSTKQYKKLWFSSWEETAKYLSSYFHLDIPDYQSPTETISLLSKSKLVKILNCDSGISMSIIDTQSNFNVFSLSAQIVAKARVKMYELIDELEQWPDLELCYVNIDSVHVSIPKKDLDRFLEYHKQKINDEFGALKIQAIADRGYWFDIGRYWLFNKGEVVKFKNKLFNSKASTDAFTRYRKLKTIVNSPIFPYVRDHYTVMENCFSYDKRIAETPLSSLDYIDFERYSYDEVCTLDVAGETINNEILDSKRLKIDLFNRIATM